MVVSARLVVGPVTVVASVASDVRLVGCSLGTGPVEAVLVAVISDTILPKSEVIGSPVGSNSVSVADSTAESDDSRLVGCTTSVGTGPVEAEPVAVISDTILPKSEVRGRPIDDSWVTLALVTVVADALGVTSEERAVVVVSASDDADGVSTVVSDTVLLSAVVAVGASSAVVVVVGALSAAVVVVGAASSVAVVVEAGGSPEETESVLDVTVVALSVSDCASDAVVIKTGPDGPRLVRMSDSERVCLDEESTVVVSAVVVVSVVAISVTVVLVNCLLTSRGKYIFRLATGSALANVEAATSAETRSDLVCILSSYWQFIRTDRSRSSMLGSEEQESARAYAGGLDDSQHARSR